jgi:tetratricopeptide (TPR) repeat protein
MKRDPLIRATYLARKGKYDSAIRILEPEVNRYYGSFSYNYLLGACYLYSRIYGMALTYLRLAREIRMRDPAVLLGLAALYLNHGDTDRAVDLYLEVQDHDARNAIARKALNIIRKHPGPENISTWIDRGTLHVLFPPLPTLPPEPGKTVAAVLAAVLAAAIAGGILLKTGVVSLPFGQREPRAGMTELTLAEEDRSAPMQIDGSYRYILTRDEVLDHYNDARRLFAAYRDEAARVNLNRILESNGPEPIKNKARLLLSYLETPGFDTARSQRDDAALFTYAKVLADPSLYRNCHVIWRGMAGNIDIQQNHTAFDFLVGYDTRRTVDGIVRVDFDFAIAVNPERPVEVLGRIIPISTEKGFDIRVEGVALNQAGLLDAAP